MTGMIGELSVEGYSSLAARAARGENNDFLERAISRHGSRGRAIDAARWFAGLIGQFASRFGSGRQIALYESPGRANLMGMHVDHRGGIVNPVATGERICAVCSRRDDDVIRARSLSGSYGEDEFRLSDRLPDGPMESLGQWLDWTERQAAETGGGSRFINYFACGPVYSACFRYPRGRRFHGADFLLDSDLPPSSGLASSSAVVILATDFFLHSNPKGVEDLSAEERLELYGNGEWYIGTRGGTGDHAAIKLCRRGAVQPIITTPDFETLRPAPIPDGVQFVLYQSGDAANKSVEPFKTAFNAPIVSYQAAELLLTEYVCHCKSDSWKRLTAERARMDARHHRVYLGEAVRRGWVSEAEVYQLLRSVPRVMTQDEVFSHFQRRAESFQAGVQQQSEPEGGYHVRDVAAFGFSESARSQHAGRLLAEGDVEGFADMMNVSQLGDRVTDLSEDAASRRGKFLEDDALAAMDKRKTPLREIAGDYHVSTPNIDRMVSLCLGSPGVLGARLSGAGLGGMLIVFGHEGFHESLDGILKREYYEPLKKEFQKIRIVPSEGAGFY
ncbi:MAG: galactokinase family protein [Planctomycetota bacterium]|jgi:N-acetylgalactosamine kinase